MDLLDICDNLRTESGWPVVVRTYDSSGVNDVLAGSTLMTITIGDEITLDCELYCDKVWSFALLMVSKKPTIVGSARVLTSIAAVNVAWQHVAKPTSPLCGMAGPDLIMQEPRIYKPAGYLGQGYVMSGGSVYWWGSRPTMGWSWPVKSWRKTKVSWQCDKPCSEGSMGNPPTAQPGPVRQSMSIEPK